MNINFSNIPDNNIFHIFAFDILKYYYPFCNKSFIFSKNINKNNSCQKWRFFVMKKIYKNCKYTNSNLSNKIINNLRKKSIDLSYDCWKFKKYKKNNYIFIIYKKINSNNITSGKYILFNIRSDSRILYDIHGDKIEDFVDKKTDTINIPFIFCDFGKLSPEKQYDLCSKAKIFISVHGAGCTI